MMCVHIFIVLCFFFFKQKTAYEMRISDWSSDVCSSDLQQQGCAPPAEFAYAVEAFMLKISVADRQRFIHNQNIGANRRGDAKCQAHLHAAGVHAHGLVDVIVDLGKRSEEHTSELQSLMRSSYAVFCLKKKNSHQSTVIYNRKYIINKK